MAPVINPQHNPTYAILDNGSIFTFADNPLKDAGSAADRIIDKKGRSTIEPDPTAPSADEPTLIPPRFSKARRVEEAAPSASSHDYRPILILNPRSHLPKSTDDLVDKIRSECEVCQAAKHAPSRSKTSGLRADAFGDMTFDHRQVPLGTWENISLFLSSWMEQQHCRKWRTSLSSGTILTSTTGSPNQLLEIKPS